MLQWLGKAIQRKLLGGSAMDAYARVAAADPLAIIEDDKGSSAATGRWACCVEIEKCVCPAGGPLFGKRAYASIDNKWFGERRMVG